MYPLNNGYDQQHDKQDHCNGGTVTHLVVLECRGVYIINQGIGRASGATLVMTLVYPNTLKLEMIPVIVRKNVVGFSKGTVILKTSEPDSLHRFLLLRTNLSAVL